MTRRAACLLLSVPISCGNRDAPIVRLGIGAQQSISQVPLYLGDLLGLYRTNGVNVELAEFAGASKGLEALLGGSIDVLSGYYTQALQIREQGRKMESFLCIYDSLLITLAVAPSASARVQRIEDLKGAKVGVTTLGSATHQYLDFLLRSHGLSADSVTPVAIGTAARAAAAMERGLVDAGIVTDFTIRYLERRFGRVRLLSDTRTRDGVRQTHGVDAFPGTVLMADSAWLDQNAETARRLRKAVMESMDWMRTHTPDEVVARMPATHYGADKEAYLAAVRLAIPMLSNGAVDAAGYRAALAFLNLPDTVPPITRDR